MNNFLKISVVIPSFNPGKYLIEAVESINHSAKQPAEIIIVDDCSSDGVSLKIAKDLALRFSNIKVLQTPRNFGAMHARKMGINESSFDYLFFLDADDYLDQDALEIALQNIKDHDACLLDQWVFSGEKSWRDIDLSYLSFPLAGKKAGALTLNGWQIHSRGVIKKDTYLSGYQYIDHKSYANADEILGRYIITSVRSFVHCQKRYMVRINPRSTTRALSEKKISTAYCFPDIYDFARVNGYLNSKNHYEGYIWADAIQFFWFIHRKKNELEKMGIWSQAEVAIKENLFKVSQWKINQHFWRIKKNFFFKVKLFLRYQWLLFKYKKPKSSCNFVE